MILEGDGRPCIIRWLRIRQSDARNQFSKRSLCLILIRETCKFLLFRFPFNQLKSFSSGLCSKCAFLACLRHAARFVFFFALFSNFSIYRYATLFFSTCARNVKRPADLNGALRLACLSDNHGYCGRTDQSSKLFQINYLNRRSSFYFCNAYGKSASGI